MFICAGICLCALLPGQAAQVQEGRNYGYVYSGVKSQSIDFVVASMQEDDMVLFGSSELSTPPDLVPEVPSVVFGRNPYGVELACIGEA